MMQAEQQPKSEDLTAAAAERRGPSMQAQQTETKEYQAPGGAIADIGRGGEGIKTVYSSEIGGGISGAEGISREQLREGARESEGYQH